MGFDVRITEEDAQAILKEHEERKARREASRKRNEKMLQASAFEWRRHAIAVMHDALTESGMNSITALSVGAICHDALQGDGYVLARMGADEGGEG